jgi:alpha-glucosidase
MRSVLDGYPQRVLIGEIYLPLDRLVTYYGKDLKGAQLPFNFALLHTAWNAQEVAKLIVEYEAALPPGGWPNWVLGNHDQPRVAARIGSGQARIAAMLLLTLRGTPTMYDGDELGIGRVEVPPGRTQDPWEKNEPGLGVGRDPSRTPFQWTGGANAGFTSARPWLPIDPDYCSRNVESLRGDPASILTLYRALIALRRQHCALSIGDFRLVGADRDVLAFERRHGGVTMTVVLNFAHEERGVAALLQEAGAHIVLSTHLDRAGSAAQLRLRPHEGVILQANG